MPFPPPTHGHIENSIGMSLDEYLQPNNSIRVIIACNDVVDKNITKGDVVTIDMGKGAFSGCVAPLEYEGDVFLGQLFWHNRKWFVKSGERQGVAPEEMICIGIARNVIKNQLIDDN